MIIKKTLKDLMSEELPSKSYQKKLRYKATLKEVNKLFTILNKEIFDNKLTRPIFIIKSHLHKKWGECVGYHNHLLSKRSNCIIVLSDRWYCRQWLIAILAHEMVHQYQWDIYGMERITQGKKPLISHGPSFFAFKQKLNYFGIPLKFTLNSELWFFNQNLLKC